MPVFLLGAIFGKLFELSALMSLVGAKCAMLAVVLAVVLVAALMTYGGVSLFVAVFAVYPFAAELFRRADIPKRFIPATIGLGAFSFTMDSLPGSPQIQNTWSGGLTRAPGCRVGKLTSRRHTTTWDPLNHRPRPFGRLADRLPCARSWHTPFIMCDCRKRLIH